MGEARQRRGTWEQAKLRIDHAKQEILATADADRVSAALAAINAFSNLNEADHLMIAAQIIACVVAMRPSREEADLLAAVLSLAHGTVDALHTFGNQSTH